MTLPQAIAACFRKYAQFSGRASRSEFWWWEAFDLLAKAVPYGVAAAFGEAYPRLAGLVVWGAMVLMVVMVVPGLAVASRRYHDSGRSAWWLLVSQVPYIGWAWYFLLTAKPGEPGPNRFGANPVAP